LLAVANAELVANDGFQQNMHFRSGVAGGFAVDALPVGAHRLARYLKVFADLLARQADVVEDEDARLAARKGCAALKQGCGNVRRHRTSIVQTDALRQDRGHCFDSVSQVIMLPCGPADRIAMPLVSGACYQHRGGVRWRICVKTHTLCAIPDPCEGSTNDVTYAQRPTPG
jgi:hypothetical protein